MEDEREKNNWDGFSQTDVDVFCEELFGELEKSPQNMAVWVETTRSRIKEKLLEKLKGQLVGGDTLDWKKVLGYAEIGRYSQMIKHPKDSEVGRYLRTEEVAGKVEFFPKEEVAHVARVYSEMTSRILLKLLESNLVNDLNINEQSLLSLGLNVNVHFGRIYDRQNQKAEGYKGFVNKDETGHTWNYLPHEWKSLPEGDPDKQATENYLLARSSDLAQKGLLAEARYAGALLKILQSSNQADYQMAGLELDRAWIALMQQTPRVVVSALMERNEAERSGYNRLSMEVARVDEASPFTKALRDEQKRFFTWLEKDEKLKSLVPEMVRVQAESMPLLPVRIIAVSGRVWEVKFGAAQTIPDGPEFEREGQAALFFEDRFDPPKTIKEGLVIAPADRVTKLADYELGHTLSHYDEYAKATLEYTKARLFSVASLSDSEDLDLVRKRIYLLHEDIGRVVNTQGEQYDIFKKLAKKMFTDQGYLTGEDELNLDALADNEKNRAFVSSARLKLIGMLELHRRLAEEIPEEDKAQLIEDFLAEF
ncbi:MAG TPA: hypothetical protein VJH75_00640 [Patescibacteria group bacterium]|nr:hypothetical protein [Patescibacteria group bacterium]